MKTSILFKQAHALTKQVIQTGDNYRVTFGACLKELFSILKSAKNQNHTKKLTASSVISDCINDVYISRKDVTAIRSLLVATIETATLASNYIKIANFELALTILNSFYDCKGYFIFNDLNKENKSK